MPKLSAKAHIALGLSVLVTTLMLAAMLLGLIPERRNLLRESRAGLAEAIALSSSALIETGDPARLARVLRPIVERNPDLLSAAVKRSDGRLLAAIGDHDQLWDASLEQGSTETQLTVPIWSQGRSWGQVELRFRALSGPGWRRVLTDPRARLVGLLGAACFVLFYFYLRKALRDCDPSQAVPPHVRSALDTLTEGLVILDLTEQIVLGNQAFAATLGRAPHELIGHPLWDLPWSDTDGRSVSRGSFPWVRAMNEGAPQVHELLHLRDSADRQRSLIVNCAPVFVTGGACGGVLVSLDDVTQLEEHRTELATAREEAEAAKRASTAFLASVSHEIRTPLNAVLGFTEVLRRGHGKDRDPRRFLDTIASSGSHLLQLLSDLLDLSKVESGRIEIARVRFAPHALIDEVIRVLSVKAREKQLELELAAQGPIPATIFSDPTRLRQILTHLLSNAIKFTEQGQVKVLVRMAAAGAPPAICFDVIDSGIGVPGDRLEAIFDPFVQADSSITRRFGGTGLGLPISRRFARLLGGDVSVRSSAHGSTFTASIDPGPLAGVELVDLQPALASTAQAARDDGGRWQFPPARILVVDDSEENRELLRVVLEDVGLRVEGAENGRIGVDRALAGRFDVVLMDMQMPIMDGYTATEVLRERGFGVPIIAVTGSAMKGAEHRCIRAGCAAFLTKPVDIDALLQVLGGLLGGVRTVGDADLSAARGKQVQASRSSARGGAVVSRLAGQARYEPILQKFVVRLAAQLDAMDACARSGDHAELARLAHWLKGSAGTVGFDSFGKPAEALEALARDGKRAEIEIALQSIRDLAERIAPPGPTSAEDTRGGG